MKLAFFATRIDARQAGSVEVLIKLPPDEFGIELVVGERVVRDQFVFADLTRASSYASPFVPKALIKQLAV